MTWHSSPGLVSLFFAVCCLISYRGSIDQAEKDALTETAFRRQLQSDFAASDVPPAVDFRWNRSDSAAHAWYQRHMNGEWDGSSRTFKSAVSLWRVMYHDPADVHEAARRLA